MIGSSHQQQFVTWFLSVTQDPNVKYDKSKLGARYILQELMENMVIGLMRKYEYLTSCDRAKRFQDL